MREIAIQAKKLQKERELCSSGDHANISSDEEILRHRTTTDSTTTRKVVLSRKNGCHTLLTTTPNKDNQNGRRKEGMKVSLHALTIKPVSKEEGILSITVPYPAIQ